MNFLISETGPLRALSDKVSHSDHHLLLSFVICKEMINISHAMV